MRINRPDGISQENRSHPFFIMLRRFSDEEMEKAEILTRFFVSYLVLVIASVIMAIITIATGMTGDCVILVFVPYVGLRAMDFMRYRQLRSLISATCFKDVERMIFSNDYQLSNLNMEEIINTMTRCARVIGAMDQLHDELRRAVRIECIFILALVAQILYKVVSM